MIRLFLIAMLTVLFPAGLRGATFIPQNSNWKYLKGTADASTPDTTAWRQSNFDDSSWSSGISPVYYGEPLNGTLLSDMQGGYTSVYFRKSFTIQDPSAISDLILETLSDDGLIVWINGHEVYRFNMRDGEIPFNASSLPALGEPIPWETTSISGASNILVPGVNVMAVHGFNSSLANSTDFIFNAALSGIVDETPPILLSTVPDRGALVRALTSIEVVFSEGVTGVNPSDLLINGSPASKVTPYDTDDYVFEFPEPPPGNVQVSFAPGHGITDLSPGANSFSGASWTYNFDPNAPVPGILISEFMADNKDTLNDEDGDSSDWLEIFNPTDTPIDLNGWFLSADSKNLAQWKIPGVSLDANSYLVIFASGKNRSNPSSKLHTNFKIKNEGGFLALSDPRTNIVSSFSPYPAQNEDVSYGRERSNPFLLGYFTTPTPGGPNLPGGPGFAPPVRFSVEGGTFTSSFQLALSSTSSNAVIRYVIGTNLPTEFSAVYSGPLTISTSCVVRARAFETGLLPGEPRSETYLSLNSSVVNRTSDLPIVIMHDLGGGAPTANADRFVLMQIFEPKNGVASMTNAPDLSERARFRKRGSSTEGLAKWSLAVETWDEFGDDKKVKVVGMPEESDWVFYAPNNFEPVLIHNPFIYELSRELGPYAPRTRFVELYINTGGGQVTSANYFGIYVIEEKIKRGSDRVDIDKLEPEHLTAPAVTGGYMLKIDRSDPNDFPFYAADQSINFVDPKGPIIRTAGRQAQEDYIVNYINDFGNALNAPNYKDPINGYAKYIDVPSWIDHSILNVLAFNVDALRLSTYFYKPRNGKLTFGPIWDFDRALGSTDGRDSNPKVWADAFGDGTDFFNYPWWGQLFTDIDFWQKWVDRYQQARANQLSTTNINRLIDQLSGQVRQAQPRESAKWGWSPTNYQSAINSMKSWLANRTTFMDTQFVARPLLNLPAGPVTNGTSITLQGPSGATIYYTLDGTDPRAPGGAVSAKALTYSSPITIQNNARVFARARNLNSRNLTGPRNPPLSTPWSSYSAATYVVQTPPLAVTEIMFNPPSAPPGINYTNEDYEYIELKNNGSTTLNLPGFSFTNGIDFQFTSGTLNPGERILVVKNRTVFESRYGTGLRIAGEYTGSLDNSGERIALVGPLQEPIADFAYNNSWYPITDGLGFSLVLRDENSPFDSYGLASTWRAGSRVRGTPAAPEPVAPQFANVLINEALTHTDPPFVDEIELFNSSLTGASIGGWYLTDDFFEPKKYKIPTGTSISAGAYLRFNENQFNVGPTSFSLSSHGDEVYLFSADAAGELTGYYHGFDFGAAANGVTFGRYTTSDNRELFVAQTSPSLGVANVGPLTGPAIITEIMYQPVPLGTNDNTFDEFVEIQNISNQTLPLYDPAHTTNTWQFRGGADFDFPSGISLGSGQLLLLVNFDPSTNATTTADFRTRFNIAPTIPLFGPLQGKLGNFGEHLVLKRPDSPEPPGDPDAGFVPYIAVDELTYSSFSPWPADAAGTGKSIQRIAAFPDDPISWRSGNPNPGISTYLTGNSDDDGDGLPNTWELAHGLDPHTNLGVNGANGDFDADGATNMQEYISGTDPANPSSYLALQITVSAIPSLSFIAQPGNSYSIFYKTNLSDALWTKLTDIPASQAQVTQTIPDSNAGSSTRFYRLVTPQQ
jgi:hypothetical protein